MERKKGKKLYFVIFSIIYILIGVQYVNRISNMLYNFNENRIGRPKNPTSDETSLVFYS